MKNFVVIFTFILFGCSFSDAGSGEDLFDPSVPAIIISDAGDAISYPHDISPLPAKALIVPADADVIIDSGVSGILLDAMSDSAIIPVVDSDQIEYNCKTVLDGYLQYNRLCKNYDSGSDYVDSQASSFGVDSGYDVGIELGDEISLRIYCAKEGWNYYYKPYYDEPCSPLFISLKCGEDILNQCN